jgi:hypothetical protein
MAKYYFIAVLLLGAEQLNTLFVSSLISYYINKRSLAADMLKKRAISKLLRCSTLLVKQNSDLHQALQCDCISTNCSHPKGLKAEAGNAAARDGQSLAMGLWSLYIPLLASLVINLFKRSVQIFACSPAAIAI